MVNPHKLIPVSFSLTQRASPPLGLAFIAGALESAAWDVQVIDCVAEAPGNYFPFQSIRDVSGLGIDFDSFFRLTKPSYDIIGISTMFSNNWLINRHLIQEMKKRFPTALIIAGGEHATAIPEYCLKDCDGLDVVVLGEGEETILDVSSAIREGRPLHSVEGIVFK